MSSPSRNPNPPPREPIADPAQQNQPPDSYPEASPTKQGQYPVPGWQGKARRSPLPGGVLAAEDERKSQQEGPEYTQQYEGYGQDDVQQQMTGAYMAGYQLQYGQGQYMVPNYQPIPQCGQGQLHDPVHQGNPQSGQGHLLNPAYQHIPQYGQYQGTPYNMQYNPLWQVEDISLQHQTWGGPMAAFPGGPMNTNANTRIQPGHGEGQEAEDQEDDEQEDDKEEGEDDEKEGEDEEEGEDDDEEEQEDQGEEYGDHNDEGQGEEDEADEDQNEEERSEDSMSIDEDIAEALPQMPQGTDHNPQFDFWRQDAFQQQWVQNANVLPSVNMAATWVGYNGYQYQNGHMMPLQQGAPHQDNQNRYITPVENVIPPHGRLPTSPHHETQAETMATVVNPPWTKTVVPTDQDAAKQNRFITPLNQGIPQPTYLPTPESLRGSNSTSLEAPPRLDSALLRAALLRRSSKKRQHRPGLSPLELVLQSTTAPFVLSALTTPSLLFLRATSKTIRLVLNAYRWVWTHILFGPRPVFSAPAVTPQSVIADLLKKRYRERLAKLQIVVAGARVFLKEIGKDQDAFLLWDRISVEVWKEMRWLETKVRDGEEERVWPRLMGRGVWELLRGVEVGRYITTLVLDGSSVDTPWMELLLGALNGRLQGVSVRGCPNIDCSLWGDWILGCLEKCIPISLRWLRIWGSGNVPTTFNITELLDGVEPLDDMPPGYDALPKGTPYLLANVLPSYFLQLYTPHALTPQYLHTTHRASYTSELHTLLGAQLKHRHRLLKKSYPHPHFTPPSYPLADPHPLLTLFLTTKYLSISLDLGFCASRHYCYTFLSTSLSPPPPPQARPLPNYHITDPRTGATTSIPIDLPPSLHTHSLAPHNARRAAGGQPCSICGCWEDTGPTAGNTIQIANLTAPVAEGPTYGFLCPECSTALTCASCGKFICQNCAWFNTPGGEVDPDDDDIIRWSCDNRAHGPHCGRCVREKKDLFFECEQDGCEKVGALCLRCWPPDGRVLVGNVYGETDQEADSETPIGTHPLGELQMCQGLEGWVGEQRLKLVCDCCSAETCDACEEGWMVCKGCGGDVCQACVKDARKCRCGVVVECEACREKRARDGRWVRGPGRWADALVCGEGMCMVFAMREVKQLKGGPETDGYSLWPWIRRGELYPPGSVRRG